MNWAAIIWFCLVVGFLIVEGACPLHLVSVWFAAGALTAMLAAMLSAPVWLQILLFLVVSAALLAAMWPIVRRFLKPNLQKTNVDAIVGSQGRVTAAIDNVAAQGQVKLGPMEWTARSTSGEPIAEDTLVTVDRIEGVKAFVSPAEIPANV